MAKQRFAVTILVEIDNPKPVSADEVRIAIGEPRPPHAASIDDVSDALWSRAFPDAEGLVRVGDVVEEGDTPLRAPTEGPLWAFVLAEGDDVMLLDAAHALREFFDVAANHRDVGHLVEAPASGLWYVEGRFAQRVLASENVDEVEFEPTSWRRATLRQALDAEAPESVVAKNEKAKGEKARTEGR